MGKYDRPGNIKVKIASIATQISKLSQAVGTNRHS
jgi:hypothetical protein